MIADNVIMTTDTLEHNLDPSEVKEKWLAVRPQTKQNLFWVVTHEHYHTSWVDY